MNKTQARPAFGVLLVALAATAGTALTIYAFFNNEGVNHTQGVAAVIGSDAIMAVAALLIAMPRSMPRPLRAVALLLLLIDILATGMAAWFLELWVLMAFMAVALLGWFLHLLFGPAAQRRIPPARVQIIPADESNGSSVAFVGWYARRVGVAAARETRLEYQRPGYAGTVSTNGPLV